VKTMTQIAALLSFGCFFIAGALIFLLTARSTDVEGPLPVCIGLCLMGTAFYLGPKLWLAAEAKAAPDQGPIQSLFGDLRLLRAVGIALAIVVVLVLGLAAWRGQAGGIRRPSQPSATVVE
jgi:hypothetical protein